MVAITLTVKNVPDDLAAELRERARKNHRSIQGELMVILEAALKPPVVTPEELFRRVKEMGLSTPSEAEQLVREARDAR